MYGVTAPNTALAFLDGQLAHMARAGFTPHLICPETESRDIARMARENATTFHPLAVSRKPSPFGDMRAIMQVVAELRKVRPDVVVAGTPKMSLILLMAAYLTKVPHRVYLCHGLRLEGYMGVKRWALTALEWLLMTLATAVVAVSQSVRRGLPRVGSAGDPVVLGAGSPNGIDIERFPVATTRSRAAARSHWALPENATVVAFVGRLTHDKGLETLHLCASRLPNTVFLVAGSTEPANTADLELISRLGAMPNVRLLGRLSQTQRLYSASDVLILPTKREGLPTVVLEASATGIPTLAYAATGTVDAVVDGVTGELVPAGEHRAFSCSLAALLNNPARCRSLGAAARRHVEENFQNHTVWKNWERYLHRIVT